MFSCDQSARLIYVKQDYGDPTVPAVRWRGSNGFPAKRSGPPCARYRKNREIERTLEMQYVRTNFHGGTASCGETSGTKSGRANLKRTGV